MATPDQSLTTSLTIRNVERHLKERLRLRAASHGQSMEAELRQILRETLSSDRGPEPNFAEVLRRRFEGLGGVELEAHPPVPVGAPICFDE